MEVFKKEIKYAGKVETVFFRELTAGEQLTLIKGQKYKSSGKEGSIEVDLGDQFDRNCKLVFTTLCDQNGERVYTKQDELMKSSAKRIKALIKCVSELNKDDDEEEGDEGND